MTVHTRELSEDEYEIEDEARYSPDPDPVSVAVGASGFVARYVIDECAEQFPDSNVARYAETFDRFYWQPPPGVLIDILEDGTPERLHRERARKRCEFKEHWCSEHGRRYLALAASDAEDPQRVRELLHGLSRSEAQPIPAARHTPSPARGKIHRPKAAG